MSATTYIALLRGINVGGRHPVPMAELRALAEALGGTDVRTYVNSGNLVLRSGAAPARLEAELEGALERRFGFPVPVILRRAGQWPEYVASNPFPERSGHESRAVMLALPKRAPAADAVARLQERAAAGELIVGAGDVIWIYYAAGFGGSRLTPALLDRAAGSPVTTRNWRTVLALALLIC